MRMMYWKWERGSESGKEGVKVGKRGKQEREENEIERAKVGKQRKWQ